MRPDSLLRLWRYINHLLLLTYFCSDKRTEAAAAEAVLSKSVNNS